MSKFRVGDRVRFTEKAFVLYAGLQGTVVRLVNDTCFPYDVVIDKYPIDDYPTAEKEIEHVD